MANLDVMRLRDSNIDAVTALFARYGLRFTVVADDSAIPGSFWHEDEAGIIGLEVLGRMDTPLHSLLHEGCHTICMDTQRRAVLHTDAEGDYAEEDAVCYLQILLADFLPNFSKERMWQDMDTWGYTFRLGSAQRWFEADAEDARQWLITHDLLTSTDELIFKLRA